MRYSIEVGGRGNGKTTRLLRELHERRRDRAVMWCHSEREKERLARVYVETYWRVDAQNEGWRDKAEYERAVEQMFVAGLDRTRLLGASGSVLVDNLDIFLEMYFDHRLERATMTAGVSTFKHRHDRLSVIEAQP